MKLLKNILLGFLILSVTGCVKDEVVRSVTLQDISFGIALVEPGGLKNETWDFDCPVDEDGNLLTPTVAQIEIKDANGNLETFHPQVFILNGKLYSQAIKLQPGTYQVTKFFLLTHTGGTIIMATPAQDGSYARYVGKPVAFEFMVNAFQKSEIEVEVLCFIGNKSLDFGFFWFELTEIVVRQFCFFGDICANGNPYEPQDFAGSEYENLPGGLLVDMPAIFQIHVFRTYNGQTLEMPNSPFSNLGTENQPLCVSYPDRVRIQGEEFSFELHILVPAEEGGFEFQHYHSFTSTDGGQLSTDPGTNNVVEFVLGNCNYSPTDLQLEW